MAAVVSKAEKIRPDARRFATLRVASRPHWRWLAYGALGAVGVVACRLAIPWPLRWALELALDPVAKVPFVAADGSALPLAVVYLCLAIGLGSSDLLQRTRMGRFTSQVVDDLRIAAVRGARRSGRHSGDVGEITARVVGDADRLRSDLNGVLVHASTNGLLYVAVCAVMLSVSWVFGVLFIASGVAAIAIGVSTSRPVAKAASRKRKKEGRYAARVQEELEGGRGPFSDIEKLSRSGSVKEMRGLHTVGRSLVLLNAILGVTVGLGLWYGTHEIHAGRMVAGDLFVFAAYALTVHRRMVQVGRQLARIGKVEASASRLAELVDLEPDHERGSSPQIASHRGLRLEQVSIGRGRDRERRARLSRLDLEVPAGSRTLVVGPVGSGKSSLLRLLAGHERHFRGTLHWGEEAMTKADPPRPAVVGFVPERVTFPTRELWQLLGLASPSGPNAEEEATLRRIGALSVARGISKHWTALVSSSEVSDRQGRLVALSRLLLTGTQPIWIIDAALESVSKTSARERLDEILERAGGRTLALSASRVIESHRFDRLVVLRRGRVVYDGPPADWNGRRERVA